MAMANSVQKKWTIEELESLPDDGNKYELIYGQLFVTPAPTVSHETILARLSRILGPYVAENELGFLYHPRSVIRVDPDTEVEPDLMVRQPPEDVDSNWASQPLPILVAEVASKSTRRRDRLHKRGLYADIAIPEYWMVDGQDRSVRIIRGNMDVIAGDSFEWHPAGAKGPLVISLADVFGTVRSYTI